MKSSSDMQSVSPKPMNSPGTAPIKVEHSSSSDVSHNERAGITDHQNPTASDEEWHGATPTSPSSSDQATVLDHEHIGVPDGGKRAWLVVLGGFINMTIGFGLLNSFGTFQARYGDKFHLDTSTITWIGSVQLFVVFFGGIFVGPAFDRYGARSLMFSGTFLCLVSFICTSFSSKFYHYLLSQGFILGIGNAMLYYPATGAISEWFNEKRALALGVAIAGSSAGGILWPIVLTQLFDAVSEPWVHRIVALISVPLLLVSCFLIQERKGVAGHDTTGKQTKQSQTSFAKAIVDLRFFLLCLALFFIISGMLVPFYYIPLFAEAYGVGPTMANNLLAIGYSGSLVGRVSTGWVADHIGRFNVLIVMGTLTSIITLSWTWMTSMPAMVAFAVLFGLFSGGLVPLGTSCVAQTTPDMGHIGLRMGAMMAFCSFGALAGGPISGAIKDHTNGWASVFTFSAAVTIFGVILLIGVRLIWQRRWNAVF